MIKSCVDYLTENGTKTIWEQPVEQMLTKLKDCIDLNEAYQAAYRSVGDYQMNEGSFSKFNFSELQIFGNFDAFAARLQAISFILHNIKTYGALKDVPLEGK